MAKTAFITGATSGFGAAIARIFAANGWRLVLLGRRRERLLELSAELSAVETHCVCADVRDGDALDAAIEALPAAFAEVDLLVNNAGLALGLSTADKASLEDWQTMVDTNIKGLMHCTHRILPGMVARRRGHIINMSSIAAHYAYPGGNAYGASKAFVSQFSRNLRSDLHGTGVRVSNIEPGLAQSEFSEVRFKGDKSAADAVYAGTQPLTPEDIAQTVYWVAQLPAHVNINNIELMPTCQSSAGLAVHRQKEQ